MRRRLAQAPANPDAPPYDPEAPDDGDFRPDGSWDSEAQRPEERNPERHLYWFVDMLVTVRRRDPARAPYRFASRINRSPFARAFLNAIDTRPENLARWTAEVRGADGSVPIPWFMVGIGSSAEAAVKYAGHGCRVESVPRILSVHNREATERTDLRVDEGEVQAWLSGKRTLTEAREDAKLPNLGTP